MRLLVEVNNERRGRVISEHRSTSKTALVYDEKERNILSPRLYDYLAGQ